MCNMIEYNLLISFGPTVHSQNSDWILRELINGDQINEARHSGFKISILR